MKNFELSRQEKQESKKEFHFKEILEIESAMVSLVKQLKEKIKDKEYDTLISDDVGGRIPTLILKKIIKQVNPDQKLETFFVASGKTYLPTFENEEKYAKLQEYLKKMTGKTKKALIITQFIFSGDTMIKLIDALRESGINNFDIASVDAMPYPEKKEMLMEKLGENKLYIGSEDFHSFHEKHEKFGGLGKSKEYSPIPKKMKNIIAESGRKFSFEELDKILGIEENDSPQIINEKLKNPQNVEKLETERFKPLSEAEKNKIQQNINFAREDVDLLSTMVVKDVWGK